MMKTLEILVDSKGVISKYGDLSERELEDRLLCFRFASGSPDTLTAGRTYKRNQRHITTRYTRIVQ